MCSIFSNINQAPVIEVFALQDEYQRDSDDKKVNLTVGAYRDEYGKPWVLPVVREVELSMANDFSLNHEYLPITGLDSFCSSSLKVLLGDNHPLIATGQIDGVQALGGTGCIFLGLQFLSSVMGYKNVYISRPTWPNHRGIALQLGMQVHEYTYWNKDQRAVNFTAMLEDLKSASDCSVILLHACAHNPTGMDLTQDQWKELCVLIKEKNHFPFFDLAYQGFASGSLDDDAWSVRYFVSQGLEIFAAQSFSKNFGLYNERVGNLAIITKEAQATQLVKGQIKILIRKSWSNPPQHGARIIATILNNPVHKNSWISCISKIAERVKMMRRELYERLLKQKTPGAWDHITKQIGMFSYTGLSKSQASYLKDQYHIYLLSDGRINMCGLNEHNIDYVSNAIHDAVTGGY